MTAPLFNAGDLIHCYTRAQALADGELRDAGALAKEAGIKFPVALTRALWAAAVETSAEDAADGQSETGRLWDVLSMFRFAASVARKDGTQLTYPVLVSKRRRLRTVLVKAVVGPGDDLEPVITLMLPEES
jgi:hypothetical protein